VSLAQDFSPGTALRAKDLVPEALIPRYKPIPELVEALPGIEIIDRSSVNAFDDARVTRAIEATGRRKLIFAGISLEVCAALPAITAVGKGLDAYVAVDASGTFSETAGWAPAHAPGGRHRLRLRDLDGGNPQRQCAIGSQRGLRGYGHAVGKTRGADRPGLRKVRRSLGYVLSMTTLTTRALQSLLSFIANPRWHSRRRSCQRGDGAGQCT
jgi:hypothetical protein